MGTLIDSASRRTESAETSPKARPWRLPRLGRLPRVGRLPRLEVFFLILGGLNAFILALLTPPFQVHDEFQHFFRSYQISEGRIWGTTKDGRAGGMLPASLQELVERDWGTLGIWIVPPLGAHPLSATWRGFSQPLEPDRQAFADFSGAAPYSPLPYLPQAAAIALGRWLSLPPLALLYFGRIANAFAAVALMGLALRWLPRARLAALSLALLPMAQFEYGSLAPDAAIIASAFLFTALALRAETEGSWSPRGVVLAALAGLTFCSIKIVYAPLLFVGLAGYVSRLVARSEEWPRAMRAAFVQIGMIVVVIGLSLLWLRSASTVSNAFLTGSRIHEETQFLIANPVHYALLAIRDLQNHALFYAEDTIGYFGVQTVPLPTFGYFVGVAALVLAVLAGQNAERAKWGSLLWNLNILMGTAAGIQLAMAVLNNTPSDQLIYGVQGRYFLPAGAVVAIVLAALSPQRLKLPAPSLGYVAVGALLLLNSVVMDVAIIEGFRIWS